MQNIGRRRSSNAPHGLYYSTLYIRVFALIKANASEEIVHKSFCAYSFKLVRKEVKSILYYPWDSGFHNIIGRGNRKMF